MALKRVGDSTVACAANIAVRMVSQKTGVESSVKAGHNELAGIDNASKEVGFHEAFLIFLVFKR